MKRLLEFLIKFKWALMFPFASLFIWFVGFLASSMERYLPYILNSVLSFWIHTLRSDYDVDMIVNNVQWFVNGVNAWIPIYVVLSYFFLALSWRFAYFAVRAFIKLITVGQV